MMNRSLLAAATVVFGLAATAQANDRATAAEAEAMVKKAVGFIKANGTEAAYKAFMDKGGGFIDRDLYVVVYDKDGKCLSHGANAKLVGKDLSDAQDVDGKYYVKERVELLKTKQSFWQDYKFTNPVTKKVEPKQMYCERSGDTAVCGGIYKS
jgi:cytochrome c